MKLTKVGHLNLTLTIHAHPIQLRLRARRFFLSKKTLQIPPIRRVPLADVTPKLRQLRGFEAFLMALVHPAPQGDRH